MDSKQFQSRLDQLGRMPAFRSGSGCSDAEIAEIEKKLDLKLPASYKAFLRRFGYAIWRSDAIYGRYKIDKKLPSYDFDTIRRTREAQSEGCPPGAEPLPKDALVLSDDDMGGYYVLRSASGKSAGAVVWYDYDGALGPAQSWKSFEEYVEWLIGKSKG